MTLIREASRLLRDARSKSLLADCRTCAEKADFIQVIKSGLGLKDEL